MSTQQQQPKKKCAYCGLKEMKYLIRCECGKYFCNGIGDGGWSHIIHHLSKSKHQNIKFPPGSKYANYSFLKDLL